MPNAQVIGFIYINITQLTSYLIIRFDTEENIKLQLHYRGLIKVILHN